MPRYFIEVAYKGTNYAGFQRQNNALTIQSEIERALSIYYKVNFNLTGSSRTDAGVHAKQNFFHFDSEQLAFKDNYLKDIYHLNSILPLEIVVKSIIPVTQEAHCRFDAHSRSYEYVVYQQKDPFLQDMSFFYPYIVDVQLLQDYATELIEHNEFNSFAKKNTQVHTYKCIIYSSTWHFENGKLIYRVTANRFLRGMVKGLVGTMLKAAVKKQNINSFREIILSKDSSKADFSVPSHGLTLLKVNYAPPFQIRS